MRAAGLKIAPEPILLETRRYSRPVLVRTWLCGRTLETIPKDERSWEAILEHLLEVHSLTPEAIPEKISASVPAAAPTARSAREGLARLCEHLSRELPSHNVPVGLHSLVERVGQTEYPSWPPPQRSLCHGDPNRHNFVLRYEVARVRCLSFDWEYGG